MFLNAGGYGMQMGGTEPYVGTQVRFLGGHDTWDESWRLDFFWIWGL